MSQQKIKARSTTGLPAFIGLTDLAAHFKVSKRTILRWIAGGDIPEPLRAPGQCIRWRVAELNKWIEAGCPPMENE
jgi:predicted DNA-binding transcriptional regulator AlpA